MKQCGTVDAGIGNAQQAREETSSNINAAKTQVEEKD